MIQTQKRVLTPMHTGRRRKRVPLYLAPFRWLNRVRAYFGKELAELRRQPLLILSLVGGPMLVLLAFGASYRNTNPVLRTAIVLPASGTEEIDTEQVRSLVALNFQVDEITQDRARAEERLRRGEIDVVQVLPADIAQTIEQGGNPQIEFLTNAISPMTENWIRYLAYAQVNEINKTFLRDQAGQGQQIATSIKARVTTSRAQLETLEANAEQANVEQSREDLRQLIMAVDELEATLPPAGAVAGNQIQVTELRADLARIRTSAQTIDQSLAAGDVNSQLEEIRSLRADLEKLEKNLDLFINTPADVMVSPLRENYVNLRGSAYEPAIFYAPAVLALLIQHTSITLGALSIVRERQLGAFEIFRVAPIDVVQLLLGKYLSYLLFLALTGGALFGAMRLLGVPLLGNPYVFIGVLALLALASLGIGFVISAVVKTDSQAIQIGMISLLLSIFFSGFFITLDSFAPAALFLSYAIPMTHGVSGLQQLMLLGIAPHSIVWIALGSIAAITFLIAAILINRQLRRA
jgi:ABC-2 type transport system permease protein